MLIFILWYVMFSLYCEHVQYGWYKLSSVFICSSVSTGHVSVHSQLLRASVHHTQAFYMQKVKRSTDPRTVASISRHASLCVNQQGLLQVEESITCAEEAWKPPSSLWNQSTNCTICFLASEDTKRKTGLGNAVPLKVFRGEFLDGEVEDCEVCTCTSTPASRIGQGCERLLISIIIHDQLSGRGTHQGNADTQMHTRHPHNLIMIPIMTKQLLEVHLKWSQWHRNKMKTETHIHNSVQWKNKSTNWSNPSWAHYFSSLAQSHRV